jgi:hypothetical protein
MRRLGPRAHAVAAVVIGLLLVGGGLAPRALAQTTPDPSDVVLVLDFSASILEDATNRNRFGAALERIADRVDATSADLVAGDATVTIVRFATLAADVKGCADLRLLGSPSTVARFANCLRSVAAAYRKGLDPVRNKAIGIDTNYVAAMQQAAGHLPANAVRPALILFTDGKHDVRGVPVSAVQPARDRLFGARTPFALLPVGMGLDPKLRNALATGLEQLRIVRNMPACVSGATFEWPQVVFQSADEAGNAVAIALQDATCTFTAAPVPSASPSAKPRPTPSATPDTPPAAPQKPSVEPLNGALRISLAPDAGSGASRYHFECSPDQGGTWPGKADVGAGNPTAQIGHLTNGVDYVCRAFAASATGESGASPLSDAVRPCGSTLECNSKLLPVLGGVGLVLLVGLVAALVWVIRGRSQGHVIAVVDVVHTANVGYGSKLGIGFVRDPGTRRVTGIVADRGPTADLRIRRLRSGSFEVRDKTSKRVAEDGETIVVIDSVGVRHGLVLRAFETSAASRVASRR